MAKKAKPNTSEIIRRPLRNNPAKGPSELSRMRGQQHAGEKFPPGLISLQQSNSNAKREKRTPGRPAKAAAPRAGGRMPEANGGPLLMQLRQLKAQIGADGIKVLVDSL